MCLTNTGGVHLNWAVGGLYVESHGICLIFLCLSTNGTVINMSKLVKKQTHMLQNGDVIYFVYRKSEPEQSELLINWIYMYI